MTDNTQVRCIHRHTIDKHPSCFKKGLVIQAKDKNMAKLIRTEAFPGGVHKRVNVRKDPWYQAEGTKIGYFDIEADNLKADFGICLSWALKTRGDADEDNILYDEVTQKELFEGKGDRRVIISCLKAIKSYDIICTYYGTGFDFPFIRARAMFWQAILKEELTEEFNKLKVAELKELVDESEFLWKTPTRKADLIDALLWVNESVRALDFPEHGSLYHFDLYYTVRSKLGISRKSLAVATKFLGIVGKTPVTGAAWAKAKYADPEAMEYIKIHNIEDVKILEELHDVLWPHRKWIRKSV